MALEKKNTENTENTENTDSKPENTDSKPESVPVYERPLGKDKHTKLAAAWLDIAAVYENIKTIAKYKGDAERLENAIKVINSVLYD